MRKIEELKGKKFQFLDNQIIIKEILEDSIIFDSFKLKPESSVEVNLNKKFFNENVLKNLKEVKD